ncbi:MAG: alpha-amylase family glycosyl hydrolase [Bacteroides sp.]|nr:alpha-amylase family glycosyl hydrolase [Bacteroides sp.]MDD2645103.1 alpha-amylase family glycosyl hydrolase [Bacteroides sp.]MDD4719578.1 alpha-amylase family glycosyl hydrolase [Bacteroides sp.]NLI63568.1 alpha-amylase [Bacteroidales bacterium]
MKIIKRYHVILLLCMFSLVLGCSDDKNEPNKEPEEKEGYWTEPEVLEADKEVTLYFVPPKGSQLYNYEGDIYLHTGVISGSDWLYVPAEWGENIEKCKMKREGENRWSLVYSPSIKDWFGAVVPIKQVGLVFRNEDGSKKGYSSDKFLTIIDNSFKPGKVEYASQPDNTISGINIHNGGASATFVLYDKDKNGESWDYAYLIGDFNGWALDNTYQMKRDKETSCWWFTINDINPTTEYAFQYYLGREDESIILADAYCEKILDPHNDQYIPATTYPNLKKYPKGATGIVSVFQPQEEEYVWEVSDYTIQDPNNLIIYELLLRDFTESGDIKGALEKLPYLKSLGVNAIELMPVQEFDGNDSWGYNPCFFFAMDKAYGTKNDYKQFIDACHKEGIAVLLDVVYNHATGNHPFAKLYWNTRLNRTAKNNPWFNEIAPHPYSVFHDLNHEEPMVREFVKRNLQFLLSEYNIDGFRFDLTKGFTQNKSNESNAGKYDASRIAILKDYNNAIKEVNPKACVILEHFCEDKEEIELARQGMKLWRNYNNAFKQTAMGWNENSAFNGLYSGDVKGMPFGGYVSYMESHDEERMAFAQLEGGNWDLKQESKIENRMKRLATNAAFCFTVPGPKMLWQFGEMGYDVSIEENGRTGRKPILWEYLDVTERFKLHQTYIKLIHFRQKYPSLFNEEAQFEWKVSSADWRDGRFLQLENEGNTLLIIGNFMESDITIDNPFSSVGDWYDLMDTKVERVMSTSNELSIPAHEFKAYVNFKIN